MFLLFAPDFLSKRWLRFFAFLVLLLMAPAVLADRVRLLLADGRRPAIERMHRRGRWCWRAAA